MPSRTDLYAVLGLTPTATGREIKDAYRALILKYHPDKNQDSDYSTEASAAINDAYKTLSDPASRVQYDAVREGRWEKATKYDDSHYPPESSTCCGCRGEHEGRSSRDSPEPGRGGRSSGGYKTYRPEASSYTPSSSNRYEDSRAVSTTDLNHELMGLIFSLTTLLRSVTAELGSLRRRGRTIAASPVVDQIGRDALERLEVSSAAITCWLVYFNTNLTDICEDKPAGGYGGGGRRREVDRAPEDHRLADAVANAHEQFEALSDMDRALKKTTAALARTWDVSAPTLDDMHRLLEDIGEAPSVAPPPCTWPSGYKHRGPSCSHAGRS